MIPRATPPPRTATVVILAWLLIAAKCVFVTWAARHWQAPVNPAWIVWPTLAFGALATGLWLAHRE